MEAIQQTFDGTTDFGNTVSATISRNGDLIGRMYLEHEAKFRNTAGGLTNMALVEHYGHSLISECEIEIGGQRIDKHYALWNRVLSDLTEPNPTGHFGVSVRLINGGSDAPIGNGTLYQLMTGNGLGLNSDIQADTNELGAGGSTVNGFIYDEDNTGTSSNITVSKIFLPLNFWFCRNPGLALPLIALQYHEVKVKMTFETVANLARVATSSNFDNVEPSTSESVTSKSFNLWVDYIYLDTDERRRFAQVSHEYLIEQLQKSDNIVTSASPKINLDFNHPIKELIWCSRSTGTNGRNTSSATPLDYCASPVSTDTITGNWKITLNGHDRFKERDQTYFSKTQVWQHHTGFGAIPTVGGGGDIDLEGPTFLFASVGSNSIAVYSFSLKPEEHQPSGTCNFSRIDNAQLVGDNLKTSDEVNPNGDQTINSGDNALTLTVFAVNYNVLRIMSGMGGLAYSN